MSLNLGTKGVDAARSLGNNPDWRELREAVLEQARASMNRALETQGSRDDAIGYARALRDLSMAFDAATTGAPMNQAKKPGPISEKR